MDFYLTPEALAALGAVIMIDIALAGDNAVVVGMAAAGLPNEQRRKAIIIGIAAAALLRIVFAAFTLQLLKVVGLMFAGGLLLLWVSWKLWREIRITAALRKKGNGEAHDESGEVQDEHGEVQAQPKKTMRDAVTQIIVADVSMSLDNVLAVAGASKEHPWVMVVGLALSVALMGLAASVIARLLHRYHWIAYVGLAIIFYVALHMVWDGGQDIMAFFNGTPRPTPAAH